MSTHTVDGNSSFQALSRINEWSSFFGLWNVSRHCEPDFTRYAAFLNCKLEKGPLLVYTELSDNKVESLAYATQEAYLITGSRHSIAAWIVHGRQQPSRRTNWMGTLPKAAVWARRSHYLLVTASNRRITFVRSCSQSIFRCFWGSSTFLLTYL